MAVAAVQAAAMHLEEKKTVHPFFSKTPANCSSEQPPLPHDASNDDRQDEQQPEGPKKRVRKSEGTTHKKDDSSREKNQSSLNGFAKRTGTLETKDAAETQTQIAPSGLPLQDDDDEYRRKRRKTLSPGPVHDATVSTEISYPEPKPLVQAEQNVLADQGRLPNIMLNDVPIMDVTPSRDTKNATQAPLSTALPHVDTLDTGTGVLDNVAMHNVASEDNVKEKQPKRQMKVSKSGKLLSSPPKSESDPSTASQRKRGRRRLKLQVQPTVTVIKYGSDPESRLTIGQKIQEILNRKRSSRARSSTPKPKNAPLKTAGRTKTTHPFFLGKPDQKEEKTSTTAIQALPPTPKKSAVTPGKLRAERQRDQISEPIPAFGLCLGASRTPKQSGLNEAPWPSRETAHVRNIDHVDASADIQPPEHYSLRSRKMKNNILTLSPEEDIISRLTRGLTAHINRHTNPASDFAPPEDVRLPTRLLTTGMELQKKIRSQLQVSARSSEHTTPISTHPAVISLFSDIEHTLTPFDQGKCELQSWTQKYAPQSSGHVLQPGKEPVVLRDWLKSLTVMSVEGTTDATKSSSQGEGRKPTKKKRKIEEDDFIVSDGEEEGNEMRELPDTNTHGPYIESTDRLRSLTRSRLSRDNNVILISGPHGCGKSATVYAVAKELGFEIFEINSASRRSGKDIQDKVGDMTENHLVNHKYSDTVTADDTDNERMNKAVQKDIESGRQGTMTSFFKANAAPKAKPRTKSEASKANTQRSQAAQAILPVARAQRKSQKQSLILFEEADILFEEDQSFWAQVTKLASQSKRPIIITCNDELQIPTHDLPLGAVLRLSPPPLDLATDYLLTLAGREGHVLQREALSQLYKSKNYDLRASITELNLWCQMSVGDRKGGLEWIYQRWPPGQDVDEKGQLLRVASEGTYQCGMGWLSHNILKSKSNVCFDTDEELGKEAWINWGVTPCHWNNAHKESTQSTLAWSSDTENLRNLEALDSFSEAVSAADTYCRIGLPSYEPEYNEPTDPSLPPMLGKARLSYTLAAEPIQADTRSDFLGLDTTIFTQTHLLIRRAFPELWSARSDTKNYITQSEHKCIGAVLKHRQEARTYSLKRSDFSFALDILALSPSTVPSLNSSYNLITSSFDRSFRIVTLDLAPYIRSIVSHEIDREAERIRVSNLLSEGGRAKKPRTTRASRVAMEGGERETIRREKWFDSDLHFGDVMRTAGKSWTGLGGKATPPESVESFASSQHSIENGK